MACVSSAARCTECWRGTTKGEFSVERQRAALSLRRRPPLCPASRFAWSAMAADEAAAEAAWMRPP